MKTKKRKFKKITRISLGTIIAVSAPIALVYTINSIRGQGQKEIIIETPKRLLKSPLTSDEVKDMIFEGKILDLSVEDLMKIIKALKSDEESEVKSLVLYFFPVIIDYVKKIENSTFRFIFEIILNKGISNISNEDVSRIEKVIKTFVDIPDKWANYIKYISPFVNEGANSVLFANDSELINKFLPKITNYIAKKLVKKSKNENDVQRASRIKKEKEIQVDIENIIRKLLIDGYKYASPSLSIRQMANDITNLVYKLTDKIPEDFFGLIKTKPIIEDVVFHLIDSIFSPVRTRIDNKRNSIHEQINVLKANIENIKEENVQLSQKIEVINNSGTLLSKDRYDALKEKVDSFKNSNRYDYLMYELDIKNEDLQYVNDNYSRRVNNGSWFWPDWVTQKISEDEWYEKEYNSYYLFAISLWDSEHLNEKYPDIDSWRAEVKKKWIKGVNNTTFFGSSDPNHKYIDTLITNTYGLEILNSLGPKYSKIEDNADLIKANINRRIISPTNFDKNDILQLKIYEDKHNKDLKIEENEQEISKLEKRILPLNDESVDLLRSRIYQFEVNNNITKPVLMKNGLLNGQGLLKLSTRDLGNFLYKAQDLITNIEIYLDMTIDKTVANNALIAAASFALRIILGVNINKEIKNLVLPIVKENLDPNLLLKIQSVNTEDVAQVVRGILDKGLSGINNQTIITLISLLDKFAPTIDLKLEKHVFSNILKILKNGLKFLPRPLQASTIHEIINEAPLSASIKGIIKGYIQ